jgi:hypothetical protein
VQLAPAIEVGYFKRKRDRGRALLERERLERQGLEHGTWELVTDQLPEPSRARYLRFRICAQNPRTPHHLGVFSAPEEMARRRLDPALIEALRAETAWFDEHLASPDLDRFDTVFFFRSDATECVRRAWHLVALIREAGLQVEMQVRALPGKVVYEDEHQVAALPWEPI